MVVIHALHDTAIANIKQLKYIAEFIQSAAEMFAVNVRNIDVCASFATLTSTGVSGYWLPWWLTSNELTSNDFKGCPR
jgi:hypothetical protein